ncbi:MAG TPA: T9SS type A sorting domain-containing protein, partial [Phototrophicaceae bacterium]|nr:T9SS type A sorting domain-containing protein [Phototrophicaceae bacterium]
EGTGNFYYFENTGTSTSPAYGPVQMNPLGLTAIVSTTSSASFADFDNDGDYDLLAGTGSGSFEYFQNTGTAGVPSFTTSVVDPFGLVASGSGNSRPALVDFDGDLDFDVFSGETMGDFTYFENTGSMSSPAFTASGLNPFGLTNYGFAATPTLADMDNDGDYDLMGGDWINGYFYFEQTTCALPAAPMDTTPVANLTICTGTSTTLYATGSGVIGWYDSPAGGTWLGGGTSFGTPALTDTVTYYVQDSTCGESATRTAITVIAYSPNVFITGADTICDGQNTLLTANGASTYAWAGGPSTQTYLVQPYTDSSFVVTGTDSIGCVNSDTVFIVVNPLPIIAISAAEDTVCANASTILTASGGETYIWSSGPSTPTYEVWPTTPTPYTVTGIDSNGCFSSATLTIETKPLPDVTVFAFGPGAATSNFTADSYLWVFCTTYFPALGTNDQLYYVSVLPVPIDYAVIITQNGCTDTSDCITLGPIGIEENVAAGNSFTVYPNPASSQITVETAADFTDVNITDVNGKLVATQTANRNSATVNIH